MKINTLFALLIVTWLAGCENGGIVKVEDETSPDTPEVAERPTEAEPSAAVEPVEEKPQPEEIWAELIVSLTGHLENDELDQAGEIVEQLASVYEEPDQPSEEQQAEVAGLQKQLDDKLEIRANTLREENLARAQKALEDSKLEEAVQAIGAVLANKPNEEQRRAASQISQAVERLRKVRRELLTWMQLLGSQTRSEVVTAQTQLSRDPETAMSLLLEAVEKTDQPTLVANSLELMRQLNQPAKSIPAIIGVLKRSEQQENWPDAIRELSLINGPGAGPLLLDLAVTAAEPVQRHAALGALARVVDPPRNTVLAVLPFVAGDGPDLPGALSVVLHAGRIHGQFDLASRRGFDTEITDEQAALLDGLPDRLRQIIETGEQAETPGEEVHLARVLACAIRELEPEALPDVKLVRAGGESEDGPAAAVLDGTWNSVEPQTMWRHPIRDRATIELDLGAERTVSGVRIWNLNEPAAGHRGWKEVDVYVGNSSTELKHVGRGIVPMAPGVADGPDYSTVVPVDFARGRYVRLLAKNQWRADAHTGLAEIQVLGF